MWCRSFRFHIHPFIAPSKHWSAKPANKNMKTRPRELCFNALFQALQRADVLDEGCSLYFFYFPAPQAHVAPQFGGPEPLTGKHPSRLSLKGWKRHTHAHAHAQASTANTKSLFINSLQPYTLCVYRRVMYEVHVCPLKNIIFVNERRGKLMASDDAGIGARKQDLL